MKTIKQCELAVDDDVIEIEEVERLIFEQEWAAILALPVKRKAGFARGSYDESGNVDYGAFATVDFDRHMPKPDKQLYKADKLAEELKRVLITLGIVNDRLPGKAKYQVLQYLKKGVIEIDDITNDDMQALGRLHLRARRLQNQIAELREASRARKERKAQAFWDSLG